MNHNLLGKLLALLALTASAGGQPSGKQTLSPGGCFHTPVTGIWQTVWIEPVSPAHVSRYDVMPDIDAGIVSLTVESSDSSATVDIRRVHAHRRCVEKPSLHRRVGGLQRRMGQYASGDDIHTRRGVEAIRKADGTRLVDAASGWADFETGDIIDRHSCPVPSLQSNPLDERIAVCGEYGGITLKVDGHLWKGSDLEGSETGRRGNHLHRRTGAAPGAFQMNRG